MTRKIILPLSALTQKPSSLNLPDQEECERLYKEGHSIIPPNNIFPPTQCRLNNDFISISKAIRAIIHSQFTQIKNLTVSKKFHSSENSRKKKELLLILEEGYRQFGKINDLLIWINPSIQIILDKIHHYKEDVGTTISTINTPLISRKPNLFPLEKSLLLLEGSILPQIPSFPLKIQNRSLEDIETFTLFRASQYFYDFSAMTTLTWLDSLSFKISYKGISFSISLNKESLWVLKEIYDEAPPNLLRHISINRSLLEMSLIIKASIFSLWFGDFFKEFKIHFPLSSSTTTDDNNTINDDNTFLFKRNILIPFITSPSHIVLCDFAGENILIENISFKPSFSAKKAALEIIDKIVKEERQCLQSSFIHVLEDGKIEMNFGDDSVVYPIHFPHPLGPSVIYLGDGDDCCCYDLKEEDKLLEGIFFKIIKQTFKEKFYLKRDSIGGNNFIDMRITTLPSIRLMVIRNYGDDEKITLSYKTSGEEGHLIEANGVLDFVKSLKKGEFIDEKILLKFLLDDLKRNGVLYCALDGGSSIILLSNAPIQYPIIRVSLDFPNLLIEWDSCGGSINNTIIPLRIISTFGILQEIKEFKNK